MVGRGIVCSAIVVSTIFFQVVPAQGRTIDLDELLNTRWEAGYTKITKEIGATEKWRWSRIDSGGPQNRIWESDKGPCDVIFRRTEALLNDLSDRYGIEKGLYRARLEDLRSQVGISPSDKTLFKQIAALRREIALANPLLDFDSLIFNCWENENPMFHSAHMVFKAVPDPGAGVYLVSGYKGTTVEVSDMLENAVVTNGRFKGKVLSNSNDEWNNLAVFNTPELSFDATELMFAWAPQCGNQDWSLKFDAYTKSRVFAMDLDGSNLRILADHETPYNDYDPLYLPNGRILFVSDRHNGGQRCGNNAVSGNMYTMKPDGSDLYRITWHETNERCPTVDNDGMLVYSRWDYIDRDAMSAQSFWTCYPDGSDPRSPHGNYIEDDKPFHPIAECNIMPIPGTYKLYAAIAAGHHKAYYGPLAIIDTKKAAKREEQIRWFWPGWKVPGDQQSITEENRFDPKGRMFTSPFPLSEDYIIASEYSEILLLDKFRNEILLFDAEPLSNLSVADAIPVRPRDVPPVIPMRTFQGERRPLAPKATIAVADVYESDFEWPPNTKITHLRICQIIGRPKLPWGTERNSWIGWSDGALIKAVIGTVPVEEDGSAYFEAPIEREIYFQAVDSTGMVVQSMLSGTYVHPGEQLSCTGCHEDKWKSTPPATPKAMSREPSKITPEVDGSYPLTYARLVKKPVFEKKCLPCHMEKGKGIDFEYWDTTKTCSNNSGSHGPAVGKLESFVTYYHAAYSNAYCNTGEYHLGGRGKTWPFHDEEGPRSRSIPNRQGARVCSLLTYLDSSHHGVQLTDEEFHRVTLWLDLNANELGIYDLEEDLIARQRAGEKVWPTYEGSGMDPENPTGIQLPPYGSTAANTPYTHSMSVNAPRVAVRGRTVYIQVSRPGTLTLTLFNLTGRTLFRKEYRSTKRMSPLRVRIPDVPASAPHILRIEGPEGLNVGGKIIFHN